MTHSRPTGVCLQFPPPPKGEKDRREFAGSYLPLSHDSRQYHAARISANGANGELNDEERATWRSPTAERADGCAAFYGRASRMGRGAHD